MAGSGASCHSEVVPAVAHLSDLHLGAFSAGLAESLVADVAEQRPDLVVVSGDLTQRARRRQFVAARALLDRLPHPLLTVPGNHDLPLFDVVRRVAAGTGRYRRHIHTELDPVLTLPGLVVVGLDSMPVWRWKSGYVSSRQVGVVRDALGAGPPDAWRLLVTHHPVLPAHPTGLAGRRRLVAGCADAGVALLLSGHTHTAALEVVPLGRAGGGAPTALSVVAGTATSSRTRGTPNSYTLLRLDDAMVPGAGLTAEVRVPAGQAWTTGRRASFTYTIEGIVAPTPTT